MSRRGAMRMFSGFQKPLAILAALARSGKGNVLPMTAAAIFLLAGMVGGGVDVSRAYMTKNRLQNACDAAALATRHGVAVNLTWAQATAQGQVYFKNNFDNTQEGVTAGSFDPETPDDGNTVNGTATATLPTIVMNLFGYKQTTLNVTCTASMGVGNSDITFVLDNTASMTWVVGSDKTPGKGQDSRMDELKDAMDSFYDTIAAATSASNARIRYSYVTYGATVNVGQVLNDLDSDYLSDTSVYNTRKAVISWQAVKTGDTWGPVIQDTPQTAGAAVQGSTQYSTSTACNNAKPANETTFKKSGSTYTYTDTDPNHSVYYDETRGKPVNGDINGQLVTPAGTGQDYAKKTYACQSVVVSSGGRHPTYTTYYYVFTTTTTYTEASWNFKAQDPNFATAANQTVIQWIYKKWSFDTSNYKKFITPTAKYYIGPSNTTTSSLPSKSAQLTLAKWPGCILERQTVPSTTFSYDDDQNAIVPSDTFTKTAYDLDIDMAPTSDSATQWSPLWTEVAYWRANPSAIMLAPGSSIPAKSGYNMCPIASEALQEQTKTQFYNFVTSMGATQYGTYHDIGLLWGARMSSPTGIWADTVNEVPDNGAPVSRHLIFMTDGDTEPTFNTYTSYGIETMDQNIGGTDLGTSQDVGDLTDRIESRSQAICDAIKARGIRLWVVAVVKVLPDNLKNCASPDSIFQVTNTGDLETDFKKIAKQVGELRITQ